MLAVKAKELLGSPDKWNKDNIKELGNLAAALLPSELKQIGGQVIKDSLQFLKEVDLNLDQVLFMQFANVLVLIQVRYLFLGFLAKSILYPFDVFDWSVFFQAARFEYMYLYCTVLYCKNFFRIYNGIRIEEILIISFYSGSRDCGKAEGFY